MWSSEGVVKPGQALKRGSCAVLVLPTADLGLRAEAGGHLLLGLTGHLKKQTNPNVFLWSVMLWAFY